MSLRRHSTRLMVQFVGRCNLRTGRNCLMRRWRESTRDRKGIRASTSLSPESLPRCRRRGSQHGTGVEDGWERPAWRRRRPQGRSHRLRWSGSERPPLSSRPERRRTRANSRPLSVRSGDVRYGGPYARDGEKRQSGWRLPARGSGDGQRESRSPSVFRTSAVRLLQRHTRIPTPERLSECAHCAQS
jgi:hypothetical protein